MESATGIISEWNNVYACLKPSFYFSTHAEPAVLVSKYTGCLNDLLEESKTCRVIQNALLEVDGQTCSVLQSAVTASKILYSVHNRSKTVQRGNEGQESVKPLTPANHDPPHWEPF